MAIKRSTASRLKKKVVHLEPVRKIGKEKENRAEKINLTLFNISNAVNTSSDLDELYASIHTILSSVIDVTNFYIALYDKKNDSVTFPFHRDEKDTVEAYAGGEIKQASKSNTITAQVIKTGRRCFFQKKELLERYEHEKIYGSYCEQWLGVPLKVKDEIIGAMVVQSYADPRRYKQKDADLLLAVSDQVALAIELKRALDIIKESEKRYRNLAEKTSDVIFSVAADGYFTEISSAIENITGYTREEILGKFPPEKKAVKKKEGARGWYRQLLANDPGGETAYETLIHPDDRKWIVEWFKEAMEKMSPYQFEYRLIKKNGRVHWVSERGVVYENHLGQKQLEGMLQDIHKRKYAEEINQVLFNISNAVNTTRHLDELYRSIRRALSRIIDVSNFFIGLYNKQNDSILFPFMVDEFDFHGNPCPELKNLSNPHSGSISGRVLLSGNPVLIKKKERLEWIEKEKLDVNTTLAEVWLGVPLKINNEVIGLMAVQDYHDPNHYDQRDIDLLNSVSDQVALAIERRRAEEALQVEKARLEQLFSDSREAIAMTDPEGRILRINQAFTDLFGYSRSEVFKVSIDDLVVPDEFHQEAIDYTVILANGRSNSAEAIRWRKDHKRMHVIATGIPIFVNGVVVGTYCIYRNITEQRRAENVQSVLYDIAKAVNATQSLDAFFKMIQQSLGKILDTTHFFIALYDPEKELIHFEYYADKKDLLISSIPINHSASMTAHVIRSKKSFFAKEKEIIDFFHRASHPPIGIPSKIWMGVPLLIRNEVIGAVVLLSYQDPFCYSMDDLRLLESVSEQIAIAIDSQRTKNALQESEKRYRTIFESTADAIFVHDMQDRFLDVNALACQRYGYTREEFLNMELKDIATHKQVEQLHERMAEIMKTGFYITETMHVKKDGSLIPTELSTKIIEYMGRRVVLSVARDITERKKAEEEKKKLEEQLRQAQKMEAIGTLAGGIAHDFNNILSPMIGYTELSLHALSPGHQASRHLLEVLKAAERAKNLVKQILTFSRQSEQKPKPIKIGPIVQEVIELLKATLPATIQIALHLTEELGTIMADPTQIHQVLMNLCTNAYHAMRMKGGILEISLFEIVLTFDDQASHPNLFPGPYLKLTISDTGHGIDPLIIGRIFDPYFTTKAPGEGTGMGLAVVHGIIRSYKGDISVYSEQGIGTTFHIYVPQIISSEISALQKEAIKEAPRGHERILVVDDEEQIVDLLNQMLTQLGYQVTARTSSIEALEAFRAHPERFDLVITDQTMPNMSGAELSQALMRIKPSIPIILCTGFSEVISESQAKAIGIKEYVMKPVIKMDMAQSIRRTLDTK